MKNKWKYFWVVAAILAGWYLARRDAKILPPEAGERDPVQAAAESPSPAVNADLTVAPPVRFPLHAVGEEVLVYFPDAASYRAYLDALGGAGDVKLGSLDALRFVRLHADSLRFADPADFGGQVEFNYRVRQPAPPRESNPLVLGPLKGFGASAREIAGGGLAGRGSGVVIAVLDSGIADHRFFEGVEIDSYNWVSDDRVKASARGHGTAVASILGGESGIAPEARLLDFRVLDAAGQGSSFDVAEAIVRAADLGADVINLSLGLYQETVHLHEAVRYAHQKGSLMVAAAGNDALTQLPFPAAYAEVLAVTAVDGNGLHAGFSNRSKGIDVAAPGVGVVVADPEGQERQINGTSAAAPFVSGTLAALLSENPGGAPENAVRLLKAQLNEAGAPGMDASYGGGLVDWDRLRERETSDLQDLAVAAIHMELGSQPGTRVPVKVVVQNRGTTWIPAAQLTVVQTGEATEEFMITSLAPGAIAERTVYRHLPSAGMDAVVEMGASVALEDGTADRRPENNTRFTRFTPAKLD